MAKCEICGSDRAHPNETCISTEIQELDSVDLAFYSVAPRCAQCGSRIAGHGIEAAGIFFCCAECARQRAVHGLEQHA